MNVDISPRFDTLIREKVASGHFATAGEVVEEALRLLQERDENERLRAAVALGFDQIDRELGVPYTPALLGEIRQAAIGKARAGKSPKADVVP